MSEEKVSRRGYVKYAAGGIVVVGVAAAGAYYASKPTIPTTTETTIETTTETPVPLRIGHLVGDLHHVGFFVAYSKGFYEEEGIIPTRLEYPNGATQMMSFSAGDLDAGYAGAPPVLTSGSKGVEMKLVASANLEGSAVVSVIAKPDIKQVKDLDKKPVGTPGPGSIQDSLLYMIEQKFGITVARMPMNVFELPLALEKGELDAYIAWEPFPAEAVVKGIGQVIYTSHDILPNHQCCVLYVSGQLFREKPNVVKRLIRAHLKGLKLAIEKPDEAIQIFADMTGKTVDVTREAWKRMIWDSHLNVDSMKTLVNYLLEQGKVLPEEVPDVDKFMSNVVDTTLLAEVEASM